MKAVAVSPTTFRLPLNRTLEAHSRPTPTPDLAAFFEHRLGQLPTSAAVCESVWQDTLYAPLKAFLARSGKLFRARLVQHGWRLAGGRGEAPQTLCLLPEILHSASLIVDDIQDGAATRRGGPALHRVIGPERALNAANWLYFWPYQLLDELRLPAARRRACQDLITGTLLDCHRGQALDLGAEVWALAQDDLPALVAEQSRLKTGRLTALCVGLGALAAGARPRRVDTLQRFGEQVGVALQMLDDLTAVLSPARHDKAGEDLCTGRPTFAWVLAAQRCSEFTYRALQQQGRAAAGGADWQPLRALLAETIGDDPLDYPRAALAEAGALLGGSDLPAAAVQEVLTDLERLERAYG
jgi:geranylgeranyl pyrophosphate synthase